MNNHPNSRRQFLKSSGFATIPFLLPAGFSVPAPDAGTSNKEVSINFLTDGAMLSPLEYVQALEATIRKNPDTQDTYAKGGAVTQLELKFAQITGKEKAIFMPSGTMANNLALRVLSKDSTKVFVQETSHLYRDEGDAAQAVHNKRLIPLAPGKAAFTLKELQSAIAYHDKGEVFRSGIGAVSIENPVRRADGQIFPIADIKEIAAYCRSQNIRLHLDGARLHLASAYAGVPIKEYASYFDTVYISLYKYLGSKGGAVLTGDAKVIDQMPHLIKIFGGNMYQSWPYAAMALNKIDQIESTLQKVRMKGDELMSLLNKSANLKIDKIPGGSNIFDLKLTVPVNYEKLNSQLKEKERIQIRMPDSQGIIKFYVNETLLSRSNASIVSAFENAIKVAHI